MLTAALAFVLLALEPPAPPVLDGTRLEQVPGPIAPTYPDPAGAAGPRDLQGAIRRQGRRGNPAAVAVPALPAVVEDAVADLSGWKAYRVVAPPGATVKARLRADHEAWFTVRTVNRWGRLEQGMLQNRIPTGNPEASFINPKQEGTVVFFLVDTQEALAEREPFRLEFTVK